VQPHARAGGGERVHRLGEHRADHAAEHVAGPGGRQRGRGARADRGEPVGLRDDRVVALEDDDRSRHGRGLAGARQAMRLDLVARAAEQAPELALMRRDDHRRAGCAQVAEALGVRVQAVGIQEHRYGAGAHEPPRELQRPVGAAEPGTDDQRAATLGHREHVVDARHDVRAVVLRERARHDLEQVHREDRLLGAGRAAGDVAGPGTHRRGRSEHRRSGQPA
jgi:hypothetical protein